MLSLAGNPGCFRHISTFLRDALLTLAKSSEGAQRLVAARRTWSDPPQATRGQFAPAISHLPLPAYWIGTRGVCKARHRAWLGWPARRREWELRSGGSSVGCDNWKLLSTHLATYGGSLTSVNRRGSRRRICRLFCLCITPEPLRILVRIAS